MTTSNPSRPGPEEQPVSQEKKGFRESWPTWMKQMPQLRFPSRKESFQLINMNQLDQLLADSDPEAVERIKEDIKYMDYELLRLFRERDYMAKYHQNRYRLYQITYMILAALATMFGSFLALSLNGDAEMVPLWSFGETAVALSTTFIAALSGREPPLPLWLENRRRAEYLRREYFRYLANLAPYDEQTNQADREMLLSRRAADINRGSSAEGE